MADLGRFFIDGGFWMWPILGTQIVSIAIIIERAIALYNNRKPTQKDLAKNFEMEIKRGNLEQALAMTTNMADQPIAAVARAGIQASLDMGGREEIQARMDEVLLHENGKLDTRTGYLAMIGNVATLLGLLGTIVGLIESFTGLGNASQVEKSEILARGISVAMNTTAYGLIVAIPAIVMYSLLQSRANELSEDMNQGALRIFNWLSLSHENVTATKTSRK
jgi:biopolymer transport protein ExbB